MSLSAHSRRQIQQQANELVSRTLPRLSPLGRRVLTALLARTAEGWHLLVQGTQDGQADAFLIGPSGVFAIMIVEQPPDEPTAQTVMQHAEERCAGIRGPRGQVLARSAIHHVVVMPGGSAGTSSRSRQYWSLTEQELPACFNGTRHTWIAVRLIRSPIRSPHVCLSISA